MPDFYTDMQSVASDIFAEFAQGTVQYVTQTPVSGATPDDPGQPTETTTTINATTSPVQTRYVDGTHVVTSDVQVMFPGDAPVTPTMEGWVTIDGVRHHIVSIMRVPPAGTVLSWTLIVRR